MIKLFDYYLNDFKELKLTQELTFKIIKVY